ncbi:YkgJ family cysteine cluster protein [uncultured Merdimonas sp.]|uniref:YkgJ family cysteine cluster protein n=1 Tax=uncultured Merdimonas sp. TaxID=2023269 RepID=UPI0032090856
MLREIDFAEVSDGKFYQPGDMVKADCQGCEGCCDCCRGMGTSIVLDPLDVHRISTGLGKSFEELLGPHLELQVVDGIILPNLRMAGPDEACTFLNSSGRCSIHPFRPGICRIFPLGRYYDGKGFQYFLQVHECPKPNKTKVKVRKWIDTPDVKRYDAYISDWHYYLKGLQEQAAASEGPETIKQLSMSVLTAFYVRPFRADRDFYEQFYERLNEQ